MKKKLKNQQGASILMALLLLLVASVVSVVILTAATTSARHVQNDRESQQAYLTVSSAAELLRDDILSSGFEQQVTRRPTATGGFTTKTEVTKTPQGATREWLEKGAENAARGLEFTDTILLSLGTPSGMEDVMAVFTMNTAYDITIQLSLAQPGKDDCRITLKLSGEKKEKVTTVTGGDAETGQTTMTTTTISWNTPQIEKGAAA